MDKNQIINLVINAALTIVTTALVTRLSLRKGRLGVTSKLKGIFTPKVRAYIELVFTLVMCLWSAALVYQLVSPPDSFPTRLEVFFMIFNTLSTLGFGALSVSNIGKVVRISDRERAERDRALIRQVSEAHGAMLKPLADEAKELTAEMKRIREEDAARRAPDDESR